MARSRSGSESGRSRSRSEERKTERRRETREPRSHREKGREQESSRDRHRGRDTRRRSRSRSVNRYHRGRDGNTRSTRDRDREVMLRPTMTTHFGQPPIDQKDFDSWVQLLTSCEQNDNVSFVREKYDGFLARYPYCYGFWTKYAEYEKRYGSFDSSKKVWERGIITIPMSIDLWLGYIAEMKIVKDFPAERIRELYERALDIAGMEFQSDRLWLDAIGFERAEYIQEMCRGNSAANCEKIGEIFDRLLSTPTMHAATHLERYIAYINTIEPNLLLSKNEYEDVFRIARKETDKGIDELVREVEQTYIVKPMGPTNELVIVAERDDSCVEVKVTRIEHDPEILRFMRFEIVARRRQIFERNMRECELRAGFEANIKRPYFHVKPLDNPQLFNWLAYLDFEIKEGNHARVRVLFERCLIACALYEEFWIKYARFAWRSKESKSKIRDIYERAKVHISSSLNIALSHSGFEESVESYNESIRILNEFRNAYPGYILLEMRYLGALRRKAEKEGKASFELVQNQFEKLLLESEKSINLFSFYSMKLARFHLKVRHDAKSAEKVLKKALVMDNKNVQLYTQLVDVAYSSVDMNEIDVLYAFDVALDSEMRIEDKVRFSQRKLDFLEELGTDISAIEDHRSYHYHLLSQLPDNATIRTRFANDPSRVTVVPNVMPQQNAWPMQQQPIQQQQQMNMMPMMPMQPPPSAYLQQVQQVQHQMQQQQQQQHHQPQPMVHLTMVDPMVPQHNNYMQSPVIGAGDNTPKMEA